MNFLVNLWGWMGMLDMLNIVCDVCTKVGCFTHSGKSGTQECSQVEPLTHFRPGFHVNLIEYL